MAKYIEWDLENNQKFFKQPHSGRFADLSTVQHVVCNVNRPDDVPVGAFVASLEAVAAEVDMIPPLDDVAPVVRCRECKHWGGVDEYGDGYCKNPDGIDNIAKENDFCSYGERSIKK